MGAVFIRELRFLLLGAAVALAASLRMFSQIPAIWFVVPCGLCGLRFIQRWPRDGVDLGFRRVSLVLALSCYCAFASLLLYGLANYLVPPWHLLMLSAGGFLFFSLAAPYGLSWEKQGRRIQVSVRFVLGTVLFLTLVFAYMREAEIVTRMEDAGLLVESRFADWAVVPMEAPEQKPGPLAAHMYALLVESRRHRIWDFARGRSVTVTFLAPESLADITKRSDFYSFDLVESSRLAGSRKEFYFRSVGRHVGLIHSDLAWNPDWGDPFRVIDQFARDESVPAWTEQEFLAWIAARRRM